MTDRFADALHRLDADRDPGPLVELAGEDTQLVKLDEQHETVPDAFTREQVLAFAEQVTHHP